VLRRVLVEQRKIIGALVAVLAIDAVVYAAFVYPLWAKVADADNRAVRASRSLQEARRELDAAKGVASSKDRAEAELRTFYADVLPGSLSAAHRLTYLTLAQMARECSLKVVRRSAAESGSRGGRLDRLQIAVVLQGQYDDLRTFIHRVETEPGFLVIDDLTIDEARDGASTLVLTLQLSTYYRATGDAS
jgi:Tfp pilus assembly protein PilO